MILDSCRAQYALTANFQTISSKLFKLVFKFYLKK